MPVPSSGPLQLRGDIALEVDGSATGSDVSLGTLSNSAGFTEPDTMSEFYGYSSVSAPTVQTDAMTNVAATSMTLNGDATADNGATITAKGFYFGTNSSYASNTKNSSVGTGTGAFTENVTGLSASTTYYATAYAINSEGESVGSTVSSSSGAAVAPTITQGNAFSIGTTTASVDATITDSGGNNASQSNIKFYFGTNSSVTSNPNYQCIKLTGTTGGSGSTYRLNISGATAGTTYYYAFNVTNSAGQTIASTKSFTTSTPSMAISGSTNAGFIAGYLTYANSADASSNCISGTSSWGPNQNTGATAFFTGNASSSPSSAVSHYAYCNWNPYSSISTNGPGSAPNGWSNQRIDFGTSNVSVQYVIGVYSSCGSIRTQYYRATKSGYSTYYYAIAYMAFSS